MCWRAGTIVPLHSARRAGRPQLKREPLGATTNMFGTSKNPSRTWEIVRRLGQGAATVAFIWAMVEATTTGGGSIPFVVGVAIFFLLKLLPPPAPKQRSGTGAA